MPIEQKVNDVLLWLDDQAIRTCVCGQPAKAQEVAALARTACEIISDVGALGYLDLAEIPGLV